MLAQQYAEDHRRPSLYLHRLKPMLSLTFSGKRITYTCTKTHLQKAYNINIYIVADIIMFMNSYSKLIHILVLIADLYLSRSLVGVMELILILRYP